MGITIDVPAVAIPIRMTMAKDNKALNEQALDEIDLVNGAETTVSISINSKVLEDITKIAAVRDRTPKEEINIALLNWLKSCSENT